MARTGTAQAIGGSNLQIPCHFDLPFSRAFYPGKATNAWSNMVSGVFHADMLLKIYVHQCLRCFWPNPHSISSEFDALALVIFGINVVSGQ